MLDGNKTKSQASSSTSAYIKAVDTSDVINHKSHSKANARTHLHESSDEVGAYIPDLNALSAPEAKSRTTKGDSKAIALTMLFECKPICVNAFLCNAYYSLETLACSPYSLIFLQWNDLMLDLANPFAENGC